MSASRIRELSAKVDKLKRAEEIEPVHILIEDGDNWKTKEGQHYTEAEAAELDGMVIKITGTMPNEIKA